MSLTTALKPPAELGGGRRFFLVGYLPAFASLVFLLLLVWAGARGWAAPAAGGLHFSRAWTTVAELRIGEVLLVVLGVTLTAVLLQPLQLALVRVMEGTGPAWPGSRMATNRQRRRRQRLMDAARLPQNDPSALTPERVQRAGEAGRWVRQNFALPDHVIRPTALGNVLAAMEDGAGRAYGLDATVAWPRLYPVLGADVRALVDERRDGLDSAARMSAVMMVTAVTSAVLLARTSWWLALALIPLGLSLLAYRGAVHAALAYGELVHVAFDLHRFALIKALCLEPPTSQAAERTLNSELSDFWRQGLPIDPARDYTHGGSTP
ncbi:hypothetical protein ACIGCZ_37660 [Streptomyces nigra]|uniref:hypothetical protein n=1 Tax=Streptomyces nigra TaxID=1827580 RepID=UPI0036498B50